MRVRYAVGGLCGAIGILFLSINSVILARGAARWALSSWEQIAYGSVAATVPWVIACMPLIVAMSWRPGKRIGYPSLWTLVGLAIWLVFAIYNLMGAGGAISGVRSDVVSSRTHDATAQQALISRRSNLQAQLDSIPKATRPADVIRPQIEAARASPWWQYSESCQEVSKPRERKFCEQYRKLESELGAAIQQTKLTAEITELDQQFSASGPVAEIIDPEARFYARVTGLSEQAIQEWLPLRTPIVLELGSMTLLGFAFMLFGVSHRTVLQRADRWAEPMPIRRAEPSGKIADLSRQLELAVWFFRECTRRYPQGSLQEVEWHRHYVDVCSKSNDVPLPLEAFRRIARNYVPHIKEVDGKIYYLGALPLIPQEVA